MGADLALFALRCPQALPQLPLAQWDLLVRQARRAGVLARVAATLAQQGQLDRVPEGPKAHLVAAMLHAATQQQEVRREVGHIAKAINRLGLDFTLLKGAAYVLGGLQAARGREFSDVDILVPKARINEVEASLMLQGWATTHHDEYDQRYYREWMHELPPMQHLQRGTVLDVHHTILPETARLKPDPALLLASSRPLPGLPGVRVLAPADMALHSMTHLFHNEEMSHGLRDLSDLDLLLREFGVRPSFWNELLARARALDLLRPLYYGLWSTQTLLQTPVDQRTWQQVQADGPNPGLAPLMHALWSRALATHHASTTSVWTAPALFMLYVRAHWLRMPPLLLARHLTTKAVRRQTDKSDTAAR